MTPRRWAIAGGVVLALLVVAFLAGQYSRPAKVVEKTVTIEKSVRDEKAITEAVEKARAEWQRTTQDHTITKVRTIYKEGKPLETIKTVYVDRDSKSSGSASSSSASTARIEAHETSQATAETTKTVETSRPDWAVDVAAFWDPRRGAFPSAATAKLERRILGPLWLGVGALGDDLADKPRLMPGAAARLEW